MCDDSEVPDALFGSACRGIMLIYQRKCGEIRVCVHPGNFSPRSAKVSH